MDTVSDRGDGHLGDVETGPELLEHVARDLAVQLCHAISHAAHAQTQHRHIEGVGVTARIVFRAQPQQLFRGDARDFKSREIALYQAAVKAVNPGGNRGVSGEQRTGAHRFDCGAQVQALFAAHEFAQALYRHEAGVAFVAVVDLWGGCAGDAAKRTQGLYPAHAKQQFLLHAVVLGAAVKPVGHQACRFVVLCHVGIHHQQWHATHLRHPNLGIEGATIRQRDVDQRGSTVGLAQQRQRHVVGVDDGVGLALPTVAGQGLAEVSGLVQQPHADDGNAQVRGRFQVVARQDPQPARILGQHRGHAEFGREVADGGRLVAVVEFGFKPQRLGQVIRQIAVQLVGAIHEVRVGGQLAQLFRRNRPKESDRVVVDLIPQLGVHRGEEIAGRPVPRPAQILGQVGQGLQIFRQNGSNRKTSYSFHALYTTRFGGVSSTLFWV